MLESISCRAHSPYYLKLPRGRDRSTCGETDRPSREASCCILVLWGLNCLYKTALCLSSGCVCFLHHLYFQHKQDVVPTSHCCDSFERHHSRCFTDMVCTTRVYQVFTKECLQASRNSTQDRHFSQEAFQAIPLFSFPEQGLLC